MKINSIEVDSGISEGVTGPSQNQIATLAYFIWMSEGCPEGRHDANWYDAEQQLLTKGPSNSGVGRPDEALKTTERQ